MLKAELRRIYKEKRRALSDRERQTASFKMGQSLLSSFDLSSIKWLHCFLPITRLQEVDTFIIIDQIRGNYPDLKIVSSRSETQKNNMRHYFWEQKNDLEFNEWSIPEPPALLEKEVKSSWLDMVLVPLLCVDKTGQRVGYGKGYYDQFLSACRADVVKIGLSFFEPIERIEDVGPKDIALDYIINNEGLYSF